MEANYEFTDVRHEMFAPMKGHLFEPFENTRIDDGHRHDHAHDHHDHHGHSHNNTHGQDSASRLLQITAVAGNTLVAAAEGATSVVVDKGEIIGGTLSVLGDFLHNLGDAGAYWMQFSMARNGHRLSPEAVMKRRRLSHTLIMLSSLYVVGHAGYEMLDGEKETIHNPATVYAATASVALSSAVYAGVKVQAKLQRDAEVFNGGIVSAGSKAAKDDISKHLLRVDIPSAVLALGGSWMQRQGVDMDIATYNIPADQVAAVLSGGAAAYWFRPTKKNLAHGCSGTHL